MSHGHFPNPMNKNYPTTREVARRLGITERHARRLIRNRDHRICALQERPSKEEALKQHLWEYCSHAVKILELAQAMWAIRREMIIIGESQPELFTQGGRKLGTVFLRLDAIYKPLNNLVVAIIEADRICRFTGYDWDAVSSKKQSAISSPEDS